MEAKTSHTWGSSSVPFFSAYNSPFHVANSSGSLHLLGIYGSPLPFQSLMAEVPHTQNEILEKIFNFLLGPLPLFSGLTLSILLFICRLRRRLRISLNPISAITSVLRRVGLSSWLPREPHPGYELQTLPIIRLANTVQPPDLPPRQSRQEISVQCPSARPSLSHPSSSSVVELN